MIGHFARGVAAVAVFVSVQAVPAAAQRWATSNGSGTNCSRTSPCSFLQAVVNAPFDGSEVRCLDAIEAIGTYTISRPMTVNCEEFPVTLRQSSLTITTSSPTAAVKLRGVNFNGSSEEVGVVHYLNFTGQGLLTIEKSNVLATAGTTGGVSIRPSGPAKLVMSDSTVADHGSGGNIVIRPTGNAPFQAVFNRVTTAGSTFGIKADGNGQSSGIIDVEVRDSVASGHSANGFIAVSNPGQAQVRFKITNSTAAGNAAYGAVASGAQAFMIVGGSSFTGNGTGLGQLAGSTVASYGTNDINFNGTNTAGSITGIPLR